MVLVSSKWGTGTYKIFSSPVDKVHLSKKKKGCSIVNLPSFFVHRYFLVVHLWPFQNQLFYRFLVLQPKHYVQQDPDERPEMKCVT